MAVSRETETHLGNHFHIDSRLQEWLDLFIHPQKIPMTMEERSPQIRYKTGLFIMRGQPPHDGHFYALQEGLNSCETVTIGIGSANAKSDDPNNPFPAEVRKKMIIDELTRRDLMPKINKIVLLDDFGNDQKWFDNVMLKAGEFDVIIGNNEWVNKIFENRGIKAIRTALKDRGHLQGTVIRDFLTKIGFSLKVRQNYIT